LWDRVVSANLFESSISFQVPVYIAQGKYDYQVSYTLAREYFEIVKAPDKLFFTFEKSAHSPNIEEPEKFVQIIRNIASTGEITGGSDGQTALFAGKSNRADEANALELFYNDYKIMKYDEHKTYGNTIQMNFSLKIINSNKLNILENDVIPIIYININNKRYLAKGQLSVLSTFPEECDCMFPVNNEGKIEFFESQIISFLGFENRNKLKIQKH
jgi:hypothetical protein